MYHLATLFPAIKRLNIPFTRDQIMLLLVASTELGLALETYLAHMISGTIVTNEWISILFGVAAGIALLIAGIIALRNRPLAMLIATVTLVASIAVGLLGAYFHLRRIALPAAPPGERVSVNLLIWGPPILGPLTYAMAGLLGLSAVFYENPIDSGRLVLPGGWRVRMPLPKTRAYFLIVSLGILATLISSVLDHARTPFDNPGVWIPVSAGVFGVVTAFVVGALEKPRRADLLFYFTAMVILIITGVLGVAYHVANDLTPAGALVTERFIRGAPFLAPMLFALMGTYGVAVMFDPNEKISV
ncbi:MAG: hypothetical protein JXB47_14825 [Anaerolineae bacterium]|nr:hypothetical protein [Anaerolineae bacterium]